MLDNAGDEEDMGRYLALSRLATEPEWAKWKPCLSVLTAISDGFLHSWC
jgi:hypothetical protein